jgi:hypothetical protein
VTSGSVSSAASASASPRSLTSPNWISTLSSRCPLSVATLRARSNVFTSQ